MTSASFARHAFHPDPTLIFMQVDSPLKCDPVWYVSVIWSSLFQVLCFKLNIMLFIM